MTIAKPIIIATFSCMAFILAFGLSVGVLSAHDGAENPELYRSAGNESADAPSGRLVLRVPAARESSTSEPPPAEIGEPPAEPSDPDFRDENPDWRYIDEPLGNAVLFIIDVSNSMNTADANGGEDEEGNVVTSMSRLAAVKSALIELVRQVDSDFRFDIIWLAGGNHAKSDPPNTSVWKGELIEASDENRDDAITAIRNQGTWYGTPTWRALKRACEEYEDTLSTLVLLTDGAPYPREVSGEWGDNQIPAIHRDFANWFAGKKANGCNLLGIHVGNNQAAGNFLQDWCARNDAKYIRR